MRVALASLAITSLATRVASAQPAETALVWNAPDSCPVVGDVEARVVHRVGAPLDALDHRVDVEVTLDGGAFVATIAIESPAAHEVRTLRAATCAELVDAVSVIVSRLARAHVAYEPPAEPSAAIDPDVPDRVEAAPPARAPRGWTIGARVSGLGGLGLLPAFAVGGEIAALFEGGPYRFEIARASFATDRAPTIAPTSLVDHIDVRFAATAVRAGRRLGELPVHVIGFGELGTMTGSSVGGVAARARSERWIGLGAGVIAELHPVPWLGFVAGVDLAVAAERPRFELGDGTPVFEPAAVTARFSAGIELRVP